MTKNELMDRLTELEEENKKLKEKVESLEDETEELLGRVAELENEREELQGHHELRDKLAGEIVKSLNLHRMSRPVMSLFYEGSLYDLVTDWEQAGMALSQ